MKNQNIKIRVNEKEKSNMLRCASMEGLNLSNYIRHLVVKDCKEKGVTYENSIATIEN